MRLDVDNKSTVTITTRKAVLVELNCRVHIELHCLRLAEKKWLGFVRNEKAKASPPAQASLNRKDCVMIRSISITFWTKADPVLSPPAA
jgi:hypothetical protein